MTQDRPFLGILFMLGFCILAPLSDAVGKYIGPDIALLVLVMMRFLIQAVILTPLVAIQGQSWRLPEGLFWPVLLRTILQTFGIGFMFAGLAYLPLADALAIAYVMPFLMLALGYFFMGETVGSHRIAACVVGFCGTLLVIQPNFAEVGWPALFPVAVAVIYAFFMMVTRQIAKKIDAIHLQAVTGWQGSLLLIPVLLLFPNAPGIAMPWPDLTPLVLLGVFGVLGTVSHLLMTWSLRYAPAATLAPMQYLEIPIGTLFGWLIFSDLPNGLAAVGICITIGAGLYIILREQRLSRQPDGETAV